MSIGISKDDALVIKGWEKEAFVEKIFNSSFGWLMKAGVIKETDAFMGFDKYGTEITVPFVKQIDGPGKTSGARMAGNEKTLELDHFKMQIGETRQAVIIPSARSLEQIRTNVDFEEKARKILPEWHIKCLITSIYNHLCGNTANVLSVLGRTPFAGDDIEQLRGHNAVTAPTEGRIYRPGGKTTDEALISSDTLTLDFIRNSVVKASREGQPLVPSIGANDGFIVIVSPSQAEQLLSDAKTHQIGLSSLEARKDSFIEKAYPYPATSPRKVLSAYGFDIYQDPYISDGVNSTTNESIGSVHRAVVVGKDALCFGSKFPIRTFEGATDKQSIPLVFSNPEYQDYQKIIGFSTDMIYGTKKYVFDGQDYGTIVLPSYVG